MQISTKSRDLNNVKISYRDWCKLVRQNLGRERFSAILLRMVENRIRRAVFDDKPGIKKIHSISHGSSKPHLMRDHNHRHPRISHKDYDIQHFSYAMCAKFTPRMVIDKCRNRITVDRYMQPPIFGINR